MLPDAGVTGRRSEQQLAPGDPRVAEYLRLRWAERWSTLGSFESYPPAMWSKAIRQWFDDETKRIEALLARVDARLGTGATS